MHDVEVVDFNGINLVRIGQPGMARDAQGKPVKYIECTVAEARSLADQLLVALDDRPNV